MCILNGCGRVSYKPIIGAHKSQHIPWGLGNPFNLRCHERTDKMTAKVGFIGTGRMASALIRGAISKGALTPEDVIASNIHADSRERAARELGIRVVEDPRDVVSEADVVFLAVKPAQIPDVFASGDLGFDTSKTLVSIAAGVTIETLKSYVPDSKILRVMPNICSTVSASATGFCRSSDMSDEDVAKARLVLDAVGLCYEFKEKDMDAVSSVVGCAPAFMFMAVDAMADGAVLMGLPRDKSIMLAAQAMLGAAKTILETGQHPGALKDSVCSPGGSTIEGVKVLEDYAFRAALAEAIRACTDKNRELGK